MKYYPYAVTILCALALSIALTLGFFGPPACPFCIYARWIFAALGTVSFLYGWSLKSTPSSKKSCFLYALCLLVCLGGAGLSALHSAVERGWVHLKLACTQTLTQQLGQNAAPPSLAQLRTLIDQKQPARCDRIEGSLLGLTLANGNAFLFLLLLGGFMRARRAYPTQGRHAMDATK